MRYVELIIEAAEKHAFLIIEMMSVYTGELFFKQALLDTIVVVQSSLRAPADMECAVDMRFGPLHDLA